MRWWAAWAAPAAAVLLAAACSSATTQPVTSQSVTSQPVGAAKAATVGELAYVTGEGFGKTGRLYLLGGPFAAPTLVELPGLAGAPSWSPDHRWLAVQVSAPAPASNPYQTEPAALYVLRADGSGLRLLTPRGWSTQQDAWAPAADELAAVVIPPATGTAQPASRLETIDPATGAAKVLLSATAIPGMAWSPDGSTLAAGVGIASGKPGSNSFHWIGQLQTRPASGGPARIVRTWTGGLLELAGWWPDGSGLLYWPDPQGSASIAADGLPLDSITLGAAAASRTLVATMLVHSSWIAFAPGGHELAAVSGGDREIWQGGKQITVCGQQAGCRPVPQPRGTVSLQPSWSPAGRLTFARGSASGPFGPNGQADFSAAWINRWYATQQIWSAASTGAGQTPIVGAGAGALDPVWASNGALMFVRDNWLWLLPARSDSPERVAGPLDDVSNDTFYGYVPYPRLIAWTAAVPQATAGTG